jgi:HEAT repeat protein
MPDAADQPSSTPPVRTWRPMVLWSSAILLVLGLVWFVGSLVLSVLATRRAVIEYSTSRFFVDSPTPEQKALDRLGSPETAATRLSLYLRLPHKLAPHKVFAVQLLGHCGPVGVRELTRALRSDNSAVQRAAACTLVRLEPRGGVAASELLRLVRMGTGDTSADSMSQEDAVDIDAISDHGIPVGLLPTEAVPNPGGSRDEVAFLALAAMGPEATSAMASFADSPKFRAAAAYWLSQRGETAIPLLNDWLRCADEHARLVAIEALGNIAAQTDHILLTALGDSSAKVRCRAMLSLAGRRPPPAQASKEAARLLESDPDEKVRNTAFQLLRTEPAALIKALSNSSPLIRAGAAFRLGTLGQLGTRGTDALPALKAALGDPDPTVRASAAEALGKLGLQASGAVEALMPLLRLRDVTKDLPGVEIPSYLYGDLFLSEATLWSEVFAGARGPSWMSGRLWVPASSRLAATVALGEIGPAAAKAIPEMELLLKDDDEKVRAATEEALKKILGGEAPK